MVRFKNKDNILEGFDWVDCQACKGKGMAWMERVRAARRRAHLDAGMELMRFENYDATLQSLAYQKAKDFCAKPRGLLFLAGSTGTGKTHLLAAIANTLIERADDVMYAVAPRVIDRLRGVRFSDEEAMADLKAYHNRLIDCRVLLLDELGAEDASERAQNQLQQVIDYRYANRRGMVIASNLVRDELPARMASRLRDKAWAVGVALAGEDYRERPKRERASRDVWDE